MLNRFLLDSLFYTIFSIGVVTANFEIKDDFCLFSLALLFFILFMNAQLSGYNKRNIEE